MEDGLRIPEFGGMMANQAQGQVRRKILGIGVGALVAGVMGSRTFGADPKELAVPESATKESWDFAGKGIEGWTVVTGQWAMRDMPDAPNGKRRALMQQAVQNTFNVIVSPLGPYGDVDVSMKFKPMSGREDASGGIVFRLADGKYYLIRANALEDNFRFYYYDRDRRMLSSASVRAPTLGQWHTVRAVAVGDRIQGWLDGTLLLDYRDQRFKTGRVGLWTKADSVTAFDDLTIRGVPAAK
jgi:hypothetical protein